MINEPLMQELRAITAYLDSIDPQWRTKIAPAPTGAAGSMTPSDSMNSPYAHHDDVEGWVTPKDAPVNVRSAPRVDPSTYLYQITVPAMVKGSKRGDDGFTWYRIGNSPDSYVRADVVTFSKEKPAPITPIRAALWPAPVSTYWVTSHHGEHGHKGIDFGAPFGKPIINPVDGFVLKAFDCVKCKPEGDGAWTINNDDYGDGYGTHAILRYLDASLPLSSQAHIKRYVFILYGHMSDLDVVQGFPVRANSPIGRVGSTGNSTGAHLHLEVRTSDNPNINFYDAALIDPELIFSL